MTSTYSSSGCNSNGDKQSDIRFLSSYPLILPSRYPASIESDNPLDTTTHRLNQNSRLTHLIPSMPRNPQQHQIPLRSDISPARNGAMPRGRRSNRNPGRCRPRTRACRPREGSESHCIEAALSLRQARLVRFRGPGQDSIPLSFTVQPQIG